MIIDDETQTEPQELTFAQKLQVRLDEARKKNHQIIQTQSALNRNLRNLLRTLNLDLRF